jgi:hypothetical protein
MPTPSRSAVLFGEAGTTPTGRLPTGPSAARSVVS